MSKKSYVNNLIYYLFCGFSGAAIAAIVWLFLKIMNCGINFIWSYIPQNLNFKYYPLVVCTLGGLILGIFQKATKAVPDELDEILLKVKIDKYYSCNNVILLCISALLPLLFGGSIGPEAGLTGVIVGLCYLAGRNMKYARSKIPDLMQIGIMATLSTIFYAPLFGLVAPLEEKMQNSKNNNIKTPKMVSNIIAVICSIGTLFLLKYLFGGSSGLPRIDEYNITNTERLWGIPLAFLGALFGLMYVAFEKAASALFTKIQVKCGTIINTTLGGILLGITGTYIPLVMFSGEDSITELQSQYKEYAPWLLILIGILKLLLTNVCLKSGWKGGHFFPVIFCGISIGYGVALLSGLDLAFCAGIITAGLLGTAMKKPFAVTILLLLCFDIRIIPWILIAAFAGSLISFKTKNKCESERNEKE